MPSCRPTLAILLVLATSLSAQRAPDEIKSLARERLARIDGQLTVPGLDSAVEVRRDRWGVPHIYARTQHDLFVAQGFVAAQDRLFQMDLWRRVGEGRLAEVLGPTFVARDRFARLLKYRGDMGAEWTSYAPDTREIAAAFVQGVNAFIAQLGDRPPVEFTLLGYRPEPWTPEVPLQRMAALSMTGNAEYEVIRAQLVAALGPRRVAELWPTIPHRELDPAPGLSLAGITSTSLGAYDAATGPVRIPKVVGSNNWVVSGAMTASGKPLLANDPHRYLDNPSLRYLSHLVAPGWNVIGAGEPGVPGVAAGHNERIGFGFTIVGMDQQDVYVETLGPCPPEPAGRPGPSRAQANGGPGAPGAPAQNRAVARCYLNADHWKPLRDIVDTINVKGEAPRIVTLSFTEHGPIVSEDAANAAGRARGFALRFVGSEPGTAGYLAQLSVNRARDWRSFLDAAARWKLPTENLVYADVDGNIGWVAAGLMPRRSWSGLLPVPGTGGYEWNGFRRFDELPSSFNPAAGFIVTANHDIRPPGYTVPLNFEFATPFRARRVTELLTQGRAGGTKFDVADFQRMQHDELSLQARTLVPMLMDAARRAGLSSRWPYAALGAWDHVMRVDRQEPLLFESWKRALSAAALRRTGAKDRAAIRLIGENTWLDEWTEPERPLMAFPRPTRDSLLLAAMDTALAALRARVGADSSRWTWGTLHLASFPHKVVEALDAGVVARGGDASTVNSTSGADYRQSAGASFREILDLADWDRSVATSVPGQSGQPESEFYANLLPLWGRGEYFPLVYSRAAVERETTHVLWLRP